jgi:CP family cyanate transporter-like MFS transporter
LSPPPLLPIFVLWLVGNALRAPILAVPPVIPVIHVELDLSATGVGILGGLPVVLLAAAALPGSLMIARIGVVRAVAVGLLLTGTAGALRGAVASTVWLYATTIVMASGIAVIQPAVPALVRAWTPTRIGFATAVYSNGLLMGGTLPVMLTIPVVLPLVHGSWQLALAVWSLPVLAIAALVLFAGSRATSATVTPTRWWPNWKDRLIWQLGLTFGSVNSMYFSCNTFLPDYLTVHGRAELISAALTALNFGQLPASILLLGVAGRLERRVWPFVLFGLTCLASVIGIASTASLWTVFWAALLGFAAAGVLVLVLALPALLRPPAEVAPVSAAMMTVSYGLAMVTAVLSGTAWDVSGIATAAFLPIGLCALPLLVVPATIRFDRAAGAA